MVFPEFAVKLVEAGECSICCARASPENALVAMHGACKPGTMCDGCMAAWMRTEQARGLGKLKCGCLEVVHCFGPLGGASSSSSS